MADAIVADGGRALADRRRRLRRATRSTPWWSARVAEFGGLHILVNNAGITRDDLLFKMSREHWDAVIATNLTSLFLCCQAATKYMVQQRYGRIVSLSSRSALGNRGQVNYAAAKAGVQGLTATLAIELGPFNINVNAVAPGYIDTAMTDATAVGSASIPRSTASSPPSRRPCAGSGSRRRSPR